jgi:hypothetical protein
LPVNAAAIARQLAEQLELRHQEYAVGGAIALGYWGTPRGTVDVDLTVYLPADKPSDCIAPPAIRASEAIRPREDNSCLSAES